MKRKILTIFALILSAALLAGCAATVRRETADLAGNGASAPSYSLGMDSNTDDYIPYEKAENESADVVLTAGTSSGQPSLYEKIIYSATGNLETVEFDKTVDGIYKMLEQCGAFVESSYVSGTGYEAEHKGLAVYRTAKFVIRVPAEAYEGLIGSLDTLGSVTDITTYAENITTRYYDTHSRLTAYQTQEGTLLKMLEKAETVSDMLEIEAMLTDVRYNIESLQTTLKNWDSKVDYSTVTLNIREVKELTEQVSVQRTYWEEVGDGFMSSLRSVGRFFTDLFMFIVSSLPVLVLLAAVAVCVIIVVKKSIRRKAEKKRGDESRKDDE